MCLSIALGRLLCSLYIDGSREIGQTTLTRLNELALSTLGALPISFQSMHGILTAIIAVFQMLLILIGAIENKGQISEKDFATRLHGWVKSGFPELGDLGW